MEKIWIIYASCGRGHFYVAQSVSEFFEDQQVKIINILDYNSVFKILYQRGYNFILKRIPALWDIIFKITDFCLPFLDVLRIGIERLFLTNFLKHLKKESPSKIILTHFLPLDLIPSKLLSKSKIYCFVTDYYPHRIWISKKIDTYFVATTFTEEELIKKGVCSEKIIVAGIPIRRGFREIKFKEEENSILIFSGVFPLKPVLEIIDSLKNSDYKIYFILYKEHARYSEIIKHRNIEVIPYTEKIYLFMQKAKFIISKPGGSTISEALYLKKICIFFDIIGGQEKKNLEVIKKYNLGIILKNFSQVKSVLDNLEEERIHLIRKNIENFLSSFDEKKIREKILS